VCQGLSSPRGVRAWTESGLSGLATERVNDFETPAERIYCRAVAPVCGLAACFRVG
jgi:hypothetical protein